MDFKSFFLQKTFYFKYSNSFIKIIFDIYQYLTNMSKISHQARYRNNKVLDKVKESDESILLLLKIEESNESNELEENILFQEELNIISNSIMTNDITFDPTKQKISELSAVRIFAQSAKLH